MARVTRDKGPVSAQPSSLGYMLFAIMRRMRALTGISRGRTRSYLFLVLLFHAMIILGISVLIIAPIKHRVSLTPPGTVYSFPHRIHEDYYFYLMVIRQGRDGFAEFDQYTTESTSPTAMHLWYLILGKTGALFERSNIEMYYGGLIVALLLYYFFSYKLAALLFSFSYRFAALAIIFFASPFPTIYLELFGQKIPLGTSWWTNMDPYSRLTQVSHHFIGQALLVAGVFFTLRFVKEKKLWFALATTASVAAGLLFYSVPLVTFLIGTGLTVLFFGGFTVTLQMRKSQHFVQILKRNEKLIIGGSIVLGVSVICLLFVQSILANSGWPWSTFLAWEANWYNHAKEIYPYTIGVYLVSFGILPLFFVPVIMRILRKPTFSWVFINSLLITPILLYLGASNHLYLIPKIRFVHSAPYVFGGLLATYGIQTVVESIRKKRTRVLVIVGIAGLFLLNIFFGLKSYWLPEFQKYDVFYNTYIPSQYFSIIDYLNGNSEPFSNVFASYTLGVYLPAYVKNNVFVGHMVSTANFWTKYSQANSFFTHDMPVDEAQKIFRDHNISYVLGEEPGLYNVYKTILEPLVSLNNITLYKALY